MSVPTRHMLLGMTLGAICATALAATGPGAVMEVLADEMPGGFDTSRLVKHDGRYYEITHEPWVETVPTSTSTIKKIEGGRVSHVNISTTATGTYSSDAMTSPHVQYPGIAVEEHRPTFNSFSSWSNGKWIRISTYDGDSFVSIRSNGVRVGTSRHGVCVSTASVRIC